MPDLSTIPVADLEHFRSMGYSDAEIAQSYQPPQAPIQQPIGTGATIGRTAAAHAGGILGGGGGTLAGMEGGALLGAPLGPVGATVGGIIGGIGGAMGGGLIGQKAQQAIEPEALYAQQQQAAEEAAQANPKTALATDIISSALASGGKPSLDALRAGGYLLGKVGKATLEEGAEEAGKKALIGTLMNAGVNPAINTGIGLATGQGMPSGTDLAAQVAGGALFSRQANWAAKLTGHGEPAPEVTNGNNQPNQQDETKTPLGDITTDYTKMDDQGRYAINDKNIKKIYLNNFKKDTSDITDPVAEAQADTQNDYLKNLSPDDMRQQLHLAAMADKAKSIVGATDTDAGLKNAEDASDAQLPWQEPSPEVNNSPRLAAKTEDILQDNNLTQRSFNEEPPATPQASPAPQPSANAQDFLKAKIEDLQQQGLGSKVTAPPNLPKVNPVVEEAKARERAARQDNTQPKSQAELAEEQFEQKGNVNAPPSDPTKPKYIGLQKGMGNIPDTDYYNLVRPITDGNGKIIHAAGSTVSEHTLRKYGVDFDEKGIPKPKIDGSGRIGTPAALQAHIQSNKATTGSILQHLANLPNHPFAPLAKALLNAADTKSLGVKWNHRPELDQSGSASERSHYDPTDDVVNIGTGSTGDARVVMEEAIHSLTSKKIPHFAGQGAEHYNRLNKYLKSGSNEHVKRLIKAYFDTAKALNVHDQLFTDTKDIGTGGHEGLAGNADKALHFMQGVGHSTRYAMGNLDEFLAQAIKDPEFQKVLESIPSGDNRSVWQNIVDAIKNLLGLNGKTGSMLESVLRTGGELVAQNRDGSEGTRSANREPMLYGKRYAMPKTPEEQSHTPEELHLPPDKYMSKFGAAFRSVIDKVRDIAKPHAQLVADAATQAVNKETELRGKWKNAIVQAGEGLSKIQKDRVMAAFNHELATKTSGLPLLRSTAERNFYNKARQLIDDSGKYRLSIGEPVTEAKSVNGKTIYAKRNLKQDEHYFPGMANQKVQQTYRNNTDHAAIEKLDKEFHDYNTKTLGLSESASQERIDNYKKSLQGSIKNSDISHQDYFNAHRKAQGTPLPPSFRETDPVRNLERYFDRAAIDASHYEFMEKNHKVLAALGQDKDAWNNKVVPEKGVSSLANNPAVKALLEHWKGEPVSPAEGNESSLSSLISSAFIAGPSLELHKTVSNIVKTLSLSSNPVMLGKAVVHAMGNVMHGYNTAVENGVVKLTARSASQMLDGNATAAEKMQALARVIRKVSTLNDLTTKVSTGLVQSMNEVIIPSKIARAAAGDVTSQKFLKNLDPTYDPNHIYSPKEIEQLASRSANYIHGTGDIRSMPAWMLNDSEFSGFFSLAHWSIAQTNNFMKDIYEPATRGDIKPLLTGVFGAAIGGYLIKELRQDIQGKKSPVPSLTEIAASDRGIEGNHGLVAYNMIAAMQFAGFGGLLSQLAKYPFDAAYKNNPQGATFPMDEVASDLASTLHQISTAIANDPNVNWVDLAKAVTMHVMSSNFQLSRIAINQGINHGLITGLPAEKKELSDKMGQLRRFDMVEGLPYNEIDEASNPYMNLGQKQFKMEQDPQKAMAMLPGLVQNIMQTYHGTPDVMMSKLKALKENSYATFPSMEQMPMSFFKYLGYLQREEGPEAAQNELQDYMKHKVINEAKASVVP